MIKEAMLYEKKKGGIVYCLLCSHHCRIAESGFGICGVRQNRGGILYTLVYGNVIAAHVDPVEKKPLYHFLPGTSSFSVATVGCNFQCGFCQNWQISQASKKEKGIFAGHEITPARTIQQAKENSCMSISYTYTEPTIFFEYAYDTALAAKEAGLYNNFVTNGYMTRQALDAIGPYLDAANVDLKSFRDDFYKKICKGRLQPVLDSITYMKEQNVWVEITTLIIPGENDSEKELNQISRFIAKVDRNIPWHVSRFHPDYQYTGPPATPLKTLRRAREIGMSNGLRYIYLGNVLEGCDTYCYNCKELIIKRSYFTLETFRIREGRCPSCSAEIAGVWKRK